MSRKSNEKMALLKDALKLEFPAFYLTDSMVLGDPALLVAATDTPATTEETAFIKMIQKSYDGFPIPSLASADDGRTHTLQIVVEESSVADVSMWLSLDLAKLIARVAEMNVHIEVYYADEGDVPDNDDIDPAKYKGEIRADVRHPNSGD